MNVLFILSDQHNPEYAGCYGHPLVRTPNIDALADEGTHFTSAYCVSPICSSTRAAMMAGRYAHEIGVWDNVFGYTGVPHGFGHHFRKEGVRLVTIGKLDYEPGAQHGIEETHLAVHRENLDITSLFRDQPILPRYDSLAKHRATGPAEDMEAFANDAAVAERACGWLHDNAAATDRPWALIVNFNDLHRPWRPPRALWDYHAQQVHFDSLDERFTEPLEALHPFHRTYARHHVGELMTPEDTRRAVIGYQGACEVLDLHVGQVLDALTATGKKTDTLVVYAADHGGTVGEHRNFDHGAMYEGSIRIPLIVAGPGVGAGRRVDEVVSALDILPTVCDAAGAPSAVHMRGQSLLPALRDSAVGYLQNLALCEYHGAGYNASLFAVRRDRFKLIECVGSRPMLFDLRADPHEMHDLAATPASLAAHDDIVRALRAELGRICSPEAVSARALQDQRIRRRELAASGHLFEGQWRRGYERDPERLVLRSQTLREA